MDKKRRIAYALVQLMDEHDTQGKELAKYLGVKPSAISNYRNGTRSIDIDTLDNICEYYHISVSELLDEGKSDVIKLTDDERDLIKSYRKLDYTSRLAVKQLAATLSPETASDTREGIA